MVKTASKSSKKKIHTAGSNFRCFDVFSVWLPQKFQVQEKISTIPTMFPDCLSVSYDYQQYQQCFQIIFTFLMTINFK